MAKELDKTMSSRNEQSPQESDIESLINTTALQYYSPILEKILTKYLPIKKKYLKIKSIKSKEKKYLVGYDEILEATVEMYGIKSKIDVEVIPINESTVHPNKTNKIVKEVLIELYNDVKSLPGYDYEQPLKYIDPFIGAIEKGGKFYAASFHIVNDYSILSDKIPPYAPIVMDAIKKRIRTPKDNEHMWTPDGTPRLYRWLTLEGKLEKQDIVPILEECPGKLSFSLKPYTLHL